MQENISYNQLQERFFRKVKIKMKTQHKVD